MRKIIIIVVAVVILLGLGFFIKNRGEKATTFDGSKTIVEVVSPGVFEIDPTTDETKRELKTGDELSEGAGIKTDTTGEASLSLPDGSVARLDPNTTIVLNQTFYDESSGKLAVKIQLVSGKLWSKVVTLTTPDSEWKVETPNAVATVRGTAFGSEHENGNSAFVGSEDNVSVKAIDPESKEEIDETETTISSDDVVEIKKEEIKNIIEKKQAIVKERLENKEKFKDWTKKQKERDDKLNEIIETLKEEGKTGEELRQGIREEIRKEIREVIQEKIEESLSDDDETDDSSLTNDNITSDTSVLAIAKIRENLVAIAMELGNTKVAELIKTMPDDKLTIFLRLILGTNYIDTAGDRSKLRDVVQKIIQENQVDKAVSLDVKADKDLTLGLTEGTVVKLKASLRYEDGRTEDVSAKVSWQVLGSIGSISADGTFTPKLDPSVAEFGESSGNIVAVYKSADGSVNLLGKTIIFKVKASVENIDARG